MCTCSTRACDFQSRCPQTCHEIGMGIQVQHPGLRDSFAADAFTVELLVKVVTWLFPDFNYQWLVDEVKHGLPRVRPWP